LISLRKKWRKTPIVPFGGKQNVFVETFIQFTGLFLTANNPVRKKEDFLKHFYKRILSLFSLHIKTLQPTFLSSEKS